MGLAISREWDRPEGQQEERGWTVRLWDEEQIDNLAPAAPSRQGGEVVGRFRGTPQSFGGGDSP
ncbi:MAG TPA: hypothetical protein VHG28_22550, partial [Longimicrobiaceae bacterium]|nr:hypothetical protein [Longimicrobiaceae bacterium]